MNTPQVLFFDESGEITEPHFETRLAIEQSGSAVANGKMRLSDKTFAVVNRSSRALVRKLASEGIQPRERILLVSEPRSVDPFPFTTRARKLFGSTIFMSNFGLNENSQNVGWPAGFLDIIRDNYCPGVHERQYRVVMIQANKFSAIRGEQYSLRRYALHKRSQISLDLFGAGWDRSLQHNIIRSLYEYVHLCEAISATREFISPSFRNLRFLNTASFLSGGPVSSKADVLTRYRYSLSIENDPNIATEKLFEPLLNGCISFYVGPHQEKFNDVLGLIHLSPKPQEMIASIMSVIQARDDLPRPEEIKRSALDHFQQHDNRLVWRRLGTKISQILANHGIYS